MILNKQQRKQFYEELLDVVCKDDSVSAGFCYYIKWEVLEERPKYKKLLNLYNLRYNSLEDFLRDELPELYDIKPNRSYDRFYWYATSRKGWATRINKLYNIIQSM